MNKLKKKYNFFTFYDIIENLNFFWRKYGCVIQPSYDLEMGAGTYSPFTFLKILSEHEWKTAYIQLSRRPADGSYLKNLMKRQKFLQYQVVIKPTPQDIQKLYLNSLQFIGINPTIVDIKFIEDNWESPTLGAYGKGWEVWLNGIEITQFTYFQQIGGILCNPISCEITYGLERISAFLQNKLNISDIVFDKMDKKFLTYGKIYDNYEFEMCLYNFNLADIRILINQFNFIEQECQKLLSQCIVEIAYELIIKLSHIFNLLEARSAFSPIEKKKFIAKIQKLSNCLAKIYFLQNKEIKKFN